MKVTFAILLVLVIIYIIPFLVYGVFSAIAGLKPPEGASPLKFQKRFVFRRRAL